MERTLQTFRDTYIDPRNPRGPRTPRLPRILQRPSRPTRGPDGLVIQNVLLIRYYPWKAYNRHKDRVAVKTYLILGLGAGKGDPKPLVW
jgi:hypothetical protein